MMRSKLFTKILAVCLSVTMVLGIMPTDALAMEFGDELSIASGEIIAFADLADEIARQTVPLGTKESDLRLPDSLSAKVRVIDYDAQANTPDTATPADVLDDATPADIIQSEIEIDIIVPVTWQDLTTYDGDSTGEYTFAAVIAAGYELSATPPEITVTVVDFAPAVMITAFDELPEDIKFQGYDYGEIDSQDDLALPDELTGVDTDDNSIIIKDVAWGSEPGFDPSAVGIYTFEPVLPEGYEATEGVAAPVISVVIRPDSSVNPLGANLGGVTKYKTDFIKINVFGLSQLIPEQVKPIFT